MKWLYMPANSHNWRGVAHFEQGVALRMAGSLSDLAERSSSYDSLTNLPGRPLFRDRLEHAIALQKASTTKYDPARDQCETTNFAVLLLDLDGFKAINDTLGHHAGDELLEQVARRLESSVRATDLVARMSGDEFNVLLESADETSATARAKQIAEAISVPYQIGANTVISRASIGVVCSQTAFATTDDYLRAADTAMYHAKSNRLGIYVFPG